MNSDVLTFVWLAVIIGHITFVASRGQGGFRQGPATFGSVYDQLNDDTRKPRITVERRAEAREPANWNGSLPDLEDPRR